MVEYYCLGKNHFVQNLLGVKVHASYSILKVFQHFGATKTHVGKIFGI